MKKIKQAPFLVIPNAQDGDSRDSSLVVYTITAAIAISLFICVFTVARELIFSVWLSFLSAGLYLVAAVKTFQAIEYLVDITSFKENNKDDQERFRKYKRVLLLYNRSVILIIGSTILLFFNLLLKYLLKLMKSDDETIWLDLLLLVVSWVMTNWSVKKWKKDIGYVGKAVHRHQNPDKRASTFVPGISRRRRRRAR